MDDIQTTLATIHQVNHPLTGQRVRLGDGWKQDGSVFRILSARAEDGDTVVLFDLNEHRQSSRLVVGLACVDGPGKYTGVFTGDVVHTIFGSRSRSVDPLPYVDGHHDSAGNARRFAEPYHLDGDGTDCQWCVTTYAPREGYDAEPIHQVNPILVGFRETFEGDAAAGARAYLANGIPLDREWWNPLAVTDEHIEHARRVIERLAAL